MIGGSEWIWIVILIVVLLVLGPGRLSKIAGEIGTGIRAFKDGITGKDEKKDEANPPNPPNPPKPEG